jgi:hypothetical protein
MRRCRRRSILRAFGNEMDRTAKGMDHAFSRIFPAQP